MGKREISCQQKIDHVIPAASEVFIEFSTQYRQHEDARLAYLLVKQHAMKKLAGPPQSWPAKVMPAYQARERI